MKKYSLSEGRSWICYGLRLKMLNVLSCGHDIEQRLGFDRTEWLNDKQPGSRLEPFGTLYVTSLSFDRLVERSFANVQSSPCMSWSRAMHYIHHENYRVHRLICFFIEISTRHRDESL